MAIARAVVGERHLLLADEPSGALDSVNGEAVMRLIRAACRGGVAGVVVTHDAQLASWADRVVFLRDGRIVDQTSPPPAPEDAARRRAPDDHRRARPTGSRPTRRGPNGGAPARRAVVRWAFRLFRREWRQQLLILILLGVAVAATVAGLAVVANAAPPPRTTFHLPGSDTQLAADVASLEGRFGAADVYAHHGEDPGLAADARPSVSARRHDPRCASGRRRTVPGPARRGGGDPWRRRPSTCRSVRRGRVARWSGPPSRRHGGGST